MRCDQIPRLFQLEWQHRLIYHVTHLVGSVSVVFKQFLSNRINEVFQFAQEENLRLIADLGMLEPETAGFLQRAAAPVVISMLLG
jgi:hypothetical protein